MGSQRVGHDWVTEQQEWQQSMNKEGTKDWRRRGFPSVPQGWDSDLLRGGMTATGTRSTLAVEKLARRHSQGWSAGSSPLGGEDDCWRVQGWGWRWSLRAGEVPLGLLYPDVLAVRPKENGTMKLAREAPSCGCDLVVALQWPLLTEKWLHLKRKTCLQGLAPGSQRMSALLWKTSFKVGWHLGTWFWGNSHHSQL